MCVQLFFRCIAGLLTHNAIIDFPVFFSGRDPQCVIHKLNWIRSTIIYGPFLDSVTYVRTSETDTAVEKRANVKYATHPIAK